MNLAAPLLKDILQGMEFSVSYYYYFTKIIFLIEFAMNVSTSNIVYNILLLKVCGTGDMILI